MMFQRETERGRSRRRRTTGITKRKLLSVVLSLVLILGLIPVSVFGVGQEISIEPSTSNPTKTAEIDVDETITVKIKNGGSGEYTFSISNSVASVATISKESVTIAKGATAEFTVTGVKEGKTTISISNNSTHGDQYSRKGTINLTVGESTEPEGKTVEVTPTKDTDTDTLNLEIGEQATIIINNDGGSSYTFTATADKDGIVTLEKSSVEIASGKSGEMKVTGKTDGKITLTISNGNTYSERLAKITISVGTGENPVTPPATGTVEITPTTDNPEVKATVDVNETLKIKVTNGSSREAYTFTVKSGDTSVATVSPASQEIAAGGTAEFTITGVKEGKTVISISNNSTYGDQYSRKGTINLTVGDYEEPVTPPATGTVEITPSTDNPAEDALVGVNETLKIKVTNGSSREAYTFTVKSGDTSVATVSPASQEIAAGATAEFTVTGVKDGKAVINIANQNSYGSQYARKATINLTVGKSVVLSNTSVKLPIGEKKTITATVIGSQDAVTWISSDTKIATVKDGEITAVAAGTATITAKLSETIYAECKVTVTDPSAPITTTYLAFTSDVHNGSGNASSADRLKTWVSTLAKKNGEPFDRIGFCGDMGPASGSSSSFWTNAQKVMDVVENNEDVLNGGLYVCGNHEFNPGNYKHDANDTTKKYSDPGDYVEEDSYILYSMGARQWDEIYSDADINALSSFLDSHSDFGGPIFILAHFPLHCYNGNTSGESSGIHDGKAAVGSAKIIEMLNSASDDYGLTIFFLWGHNHSSSNDHYDKVYTDKINNTDISFTYASAGCMSDSEYGQSGNVKGKGLVAQIESDVVTLTYYNANGAVVGAGAEIEIKGTTPAVTHTITVTNGEHGTISPNGKVTVKEGRTQTFTITPDSKYEVDTVLVDGKPITVSGNTFKIENVTKDMTVSVTYKEAQGQSYEEADQIAAGGKYIIVSNGYALTNNNGKISATPVSVDKDGIFVTNGNIASMTWELAAAIGTDKSGDYVIKNSGYMLSRVSDESGSNQPAEITTEEKYSEASTLPYFQWSYKNGVLSQIGGQDQSATFVVYYDSSNGGFYTENEASQTVSFYAVEGSIEPQPGENPTIDINYALDSKVSFKDSETLVIDCSKACFVLAENAEGNYSRIVATKQADGTYVYDLSKISGDFSLTIGLVGDVDLNGEVNMLDATSAMMSWVNNEELKGIKSYAADINGADGVTMTDATAIMMSWVNNTSLNWN